MGGEHAFEGDAGIGCHRVVDHDAVGYLASDEGLERPQQGKRHTQAD